jgi:hypothetical protein
MEMDMGVGVGRESQSKFRQMFGTDALRAGGFAAHILSRAHFPAN